MNLYKNMLDLFNTGWNTNLKVIQKDEGYMFRKSKTNIIGIDQSLLLNINCLEWANVGLDYYNKDVTNNEEFATKFERLCKNVIDKDFIMFRNPKANTDNWLDDFIHEEHGSGVNSLFWLFYNIMNNSDIEYIVVDYIDGSLHPISMIQLVKALRCFNKNKILILMNNDTLFSNWIMNIEDLYMLFDSSIYNIQDCTDREIKEMHDLQKMLRNGEFNKRKEDD